VRQLLLYGIERGMNCAGLLSGRPPAADEAAHGQELIGIHAVLHGTLCMLMHCHA
jgi:hypothetical protein